MAEIIKDGRTGDTAKVDATNRLWTQALTINQLLDGHLENRAYDISTGGLINLTDGVTDNALIFIQNNGDEDIVIDTVSVDLGPSTGGSGNGILTAHLNPNAGTIVSEAVDAQVLNRRIGNPNNLSANAYKAAAAAKTMTGADTISIPFGSGVLANASFQEPFVIPKGQAFGISYQAPPSNTSLDIQVRVLAVEVSTT